MTRILALPTFVYFEFFQDYFTNYITFFGIVVSILVIFGAYAAFRFSKKSSVRTYSLLSMMAVSSFLWLFVFSSLIICTLMAGQYWHAPDATTFTVLRYSLFATLAGGPSLVLLFRGRAIKKVYAVIERTALPLGFLLPSANTTTGESRLDENSKPVYERSLNIFANLKDRLWKKLGTSENSKPITLNLLKDGGEAALLPESLAVDWRGLRMVAIKQDVASVLQDDELEGVLAHELGHIEQGDAKAKSIATGFKISFPFDPLVYFAEAAIYRERELAADEFSARLTGKPASLASALLKIYHNMKEDSAVKGLKAQVGISFLISDQIQNAGGNKNSHKEGPRRPAVRSSKLLSRQPPLKLRIERLLEITDSLPNSE